MENTDQTPVEGVEVESQMPSELDELFQIDPSTDTTFSEEVNSEDTEDNKIAQEESGDQPTEEEESQDEEDLEEESDEEEVVDTTSLKMTIAGQEVVGLPSIIEKINSINGANTQLAGEVKKFRSLAETRETELSTLKERIKQWEQYYDGHSTEEPEKYKEPETKVEKKELDPETQAVYLSELQELQQDINYTQVLPTMKSILEEMGSNNGLSPKEIYTIAKARLNIKPTTPPKEDTNKKVVVKRAKKVLGGSNRSISPKPSEADLPFELQDLL
jgi:hypothetical protein